MKLLNYILVYVIMLLVVASLATAEPSKQISTMMSTPASVFDVYLFKLQSENWFGGNELYLNTISYNFNDNLIEMNFFVDEQYKKMKGFRTTNDIQKEKILKDILNDVAKGAGVIARGNGDLKFKLGMIQTTPIRHGWTSKTFDEEAAKEEIVSRTVIHLRTKTKVAGFLYSVTRGHHGEIIFEKEKENPTFDDLYEKYLSEKELSSE